MSKRRDLEHHRDSLGEIGEILSSMKTLAYMETRKLARFIEAQQQVVDSIASVAADFLSFHPALSMSLQEAAPVFLVVGSERGFCGDFNRAVRARFDAALTDTDAERARVIVVGHRLGTLFEGDASVAAFVDGANVVEEVSAVLEALTRELSRLGVSSAGISLQGICHAGDDVVLTALLPPFRDRPAAEPAHPFAPALNLPPAGFLRELVDHYLFAALNNMLYTSLLAENQRRVSHLEAAVRHLDEESAELTRRCRALRQEEIIEEIEVILLSAAGVDGAPG